MSVSCLYVEKKPDFAVDANGVLAELRGYLGLTGLTRVRLLNRYLIEGISPGDFAAIRDTILREPQVDFAYEALPSLENVQVIAVELLPGQFDQRADSCAQCIALVTGRESPPVRCSKIWLLEGEVTPPQLEAAEKYLINPIESRKASLEIPTSLALELQTPGDVPVVVGFTGMDKAALRALAEELGLAMSIADLIFCRDYFEGKKRNPTLTELKVLDTYWSDHCRHTTFLTELEDVEINSEYIAKSFKRYQTIREGLGRKDSPVNLMDMATIAARSLRSLGLLCRMSVSDEVNACTVNVRVEVDGKPEDWLVMFKNETHNHPTEIEPFGGAATCLGGAIRDPLSGRGYVYQALRLSGAANPLASIGATRPGKLPQKKICQRAAAGYSSYGNQIGLATGLVDEIYHPGYEAKRLEMGAVIAAAPAEAVVHGTPVPGDKVILLGGPTGRDGCGGATGSSKAHTAESLEECGSEVQKGNPPEERKIQRLFKNPEVSLMIKRCNDFGAGGVSVAIGELAPGLLINLDSIPLKYEGLSGTELAISESQERMAVVVAAEDVQRFIRLAGEENLRATKVAEVTAEPRLVMRWRGNTILELDREFLDTNGAARTARAFIPEPGEPKADITPVTRESMMEKLGSIQFCSRKGLIQQFDSTVGGGSVLLPLGGKYQLTPAQVMAAKLPVGERQTNACTLTSWAYDPHLASHSPYHGAVFAVVESVGKIIAAGGTRAKCWLTFQEYYEKLGDDPHKWGKPTAALLGAIEAQIQLQLAAIGGKDSMSGSFEELSVPPTLVSVAVGLADASRVVSAEFKEVGSSVYLLAPAVSGDGLPDFDDTRFILDLVEQLIGGGRVLSAWVVGSGGTAEGIFKMCTGNRIGFTSLKDLSWQTLPGAFIIEALEPFAELEDSLLGFTCQEYTLSQPGKTRIALDEVQAAWESALGEVYPDSTEHPGKVETFSWERGKTSAVRTGGSAGTPLVAIPVFPGTNCEYDTARAFSRAGARVETLVIRNLDPQAAQESSDAFADLVRRANIIALPGGFSAGDEPEGSAKMITSFLRGRAVREQIEALLGQRDGLILGICNGFQALVKLGLLPFGEYRLPKDDSPTLTCNMIGRHQSSMVLTRIASNKSPWLADMEVGSIYPSPVSNGEGRFIAPESLVRTLSQNGQIATQYVDFEGMPTMEIRHNPSGSDFAIEGITSPDGRVLGKMAHNERYDQNLYRNIPPHEMLDIFRCAVDYFS